MTDRSLELELLKTMPFVPASFAERINVRRSHRRMKQYDSYVIVRRHRLMEWTWAMPVDEDGTIHPNDSVVVGPDGFVLMMECFRRTMLQWNEFPKISLDGGKTIVHFSRIKERTPKVIGWLHESKSLPTRTLWAVEKTDELCSEEEFSPGSEEYNRFWWMFFVSLNGDGLVVPEEI